MPAMDLVTKALRAGEGRKFKTYQKRAEAVNRFEPEMEALTDEEIRSEADALRERARNGTSLEDLLPEAFALCREASRRTTGQRKYPLDVTYGTNSEFSFDYLRDNMADALEHCVQRDHNFAIVSEVDNILIDEARTPLTISGQPEQAAQTYYTFARLVKQLDGVPAKQKLKSLGESRE